MPLQSSISPNTSLLREFHFSTAVQATYQKLMGDVGPPLNWEVQFKIKINPAKMERIFRLTIQVKPHRRLFYPIGGGETVVEDVAAYFASSEEPLNDTMLRSMGTAREQGLFFQHLIKSLFHKVKQSLYEFDPRIGHSPSRSGPLPACPLLDPGEPLSRMGVFMPIILQYNPSILADDRIIGTHCPLCKGEIDGSKEFMWGGTNLLWVHADCWRDAA